MTISKLSFTILFTVASGVFAVGLLEPSRGHAQEATMEEVTISAPRAKTIGHDPATGGSIRLITQSARINIDPIMFTTNSGIALVKDSVRETARKVCYSLEPAGEDDSECIEGAVRSAQAQIDAAIARAKATARR
jgi:UrcA family protein